MAAVRKRIDAADPSTTAFGRATAPLPGVVGVAFEAASQSISLEEVVLLARRKVYGRPPSITLSLQEAKACSAIAYGGRAGDSTPDSLWSIQVSGVYANWITGFRAVLLYPSSNHDTRRVLAFAGTDAAAPVDWLTDLEQALNFNPIRLPAQYSQAVSLAHRMQSVYGNQLLVTGHSLGGGLASFVSAKLGISGAGVNSAPLGPGSLLHLFLFNRSHRPRFTHYNNDGELVSSYSPGLQLGQRCILESGAGVLAGHFLEKVINDSPMICYDDYFKRDGRGVTGTW